MEKVYLWYKKNLIGYIYFNKKYRWTPYSAACRKKELECVYNLADLPRRSKAYDTLPSIFGAFANLTRTDLVEAGNIVDTDTPFERLVKFSKLKWSRCDFYISDSDFADII